MIRVNAFIDAKAISSFMRSFPTETRRAVEISLDKTAYEIRDEIKTIIPRVFKSPVPYTKNSLRVQKTRNHNLESFVWFKDPDRMTDHYLVPQVEGGQRKDKGFERALGARFVPGRYEPRNQYGDITYGKIVQILSVLKAAEYVAGYSANITGRSKKRNTRSREYVRITNHKTLPPGVYRRYQTGVGFGAKTKKTLPFGEFQKGKTVGRFSSVVRARGLRPVLIEGKRRGNYRKRLPFYETAARVAEVYFMPLFFRLVDSQLARRLRS